MLTMDLDIYEATAIEIRQPNICTIVNRDKTFTYISKYRMHWIYFFGRIFRESNIHQNKKISALRAGILCPGLDSNADAIGQHADIPIEASGSSAPAHPIRIQLKYCIKKALKLFRALCPGLDSNQHILANAAT